jgi:amino acid permease
MNYNDEKGKKLVNEEYSSGLTGDETSGEPNKEPKQWVKRWFSPIKEGSLRGATITIASITFGGGCLAFPGAILATGPIVGVIIFLFVGLASFYSLKLLTKTAFRTGIMDYNELLEQVHGKGMVILYDVNNLINVIGIIMGYQIFAYQWIMSICHDIVPSFDNTSSINKLYVMLICYVCFQIPLCLLKNISKLQYASIVGTCALLYSIFVIIIEMPFYLSNYIDSGREVVVFKPISWSYLTSFAIFMFGFANHNGVLQVFNELKRPTPERCNKALNRSFTLEMSLYVGISFAGYFSLFEDTPSNFLERPDLPGFTDVFIKIAKVTLFICLHCIMAINFNILRQSVKSVFTRSQMNYNFVVDMIITIIILGICNIGVYFIDTIADVLGIVGGICTVVISFVNPMTLEIKTNKMGLKNKQNMFTLILMVVIGILGIASTIYSFYAFIDKKLHPENY